MFYTFFLKKFFSTLRESLFLFCFCPFLLLNTKIEIGKLFLLFFWTTGLFLIYPYADVITVFCRSSPLESPHAEQSLDFDCCLAHPVHGWNGPQQDREDQDTEELALAEELLVWGPQPCSPDQRQKVEASPWLSVPTGLGTSLQTSQTPAVNLAERNCRNVLMTSFFTILSHVSDWWKLGHVWNLNCRRIWDIWALVFQPLVCNKAGDWELRMQFWDSLQCPQVQKGASSLPSGLRYLKCGQEPK